MRGYLQAYEDTQEYGCTVKRARVAHGEYLLAGGYDDPLKDVDGW